MSVEFEVPPPQAASASGEASSRHSEAAAARRRTPVNLGRRTVTGRRSPAVPSAAATGQSFRSFCESWSHQLQNRRFSTAQGSSDGVGANGSS